ncbi:hypothetical protein EVJ58_g10661 [Rhodofomes roseus]|uniref:Uncharacterized protein n=1 Tax=Rhodofomes roseus TaxID=34475 RepID=A0A4Y9XPI5_9APHY|nr:hypothetical protein EVJ58_g10661 [Rhodofomes roseus]
MPHARITPAVPAIPQRQHNVAPYYYHIGNITQAQADELVREHWVSTANITVGFELPNHEPPTLIGFFRHPERVAELTDEALADGFRTGFNDQDLLRFTLETIDRDIRAGGRWRHVPVDEAFQQIRRSVRVRLLRRIHQGHPDPIAALYIESPTADPGDWNAFRERVRQHIFGSSRSGPPEILWETFLCGICHSADHPTGLCYLPNVPGWHGPTPDSVRAAAQEYARRNPAPPTHGRGGRGGGRGRGGRGRGRGRGNDA